MVTPIQVIECISCVLDMVILFPHGYPIPYRTLLSIIRSWVPIQWLTHKERGQRVYVRNFQCQTLNIIKLFITVIRYNGNNFASLINLILIFRMWCGKVPNVFYCQGFFCVQHRTTKSGDSSEILASNRPVIIYVGFVPKS